MLEAPTRSVTLPLVLRTTPSGLTKYALPIQVGTPPQFVQAILDINSDRMQLLATAFNASSSSTYVRVEQEQPQEATREIGGAFGSAHAFPCYSRAHLSSIMRIHDLPCASVHPQACASQASSQQPMTNGPFQE